MLTGVEPAKQYRKIQNQIDSVVERSSIYTAGKGLIPGRINKSVSVPRHRG